MIPMRYSISTVIPVYNSEGSLRELITQLSQVLPQLSDTYEVILVNDGSRDHSWDEIFEISQTYTWVRGINLMRNYGQHNAILCGIRAARNEIILTMDDDLQHPPGEIPKLLDRLSEGFDVVYGVPNKLPHSWWRNFTSKTTKTAMARAMGIKNISELSAFRAFRCEIREAFRDYRSPNLLLDVLLSWGTSRFATVKVEHHPRQIGKSNYTFKKLFNQTLLVLTGFSTGPLRLASFIGFSFTFLGIFILIYVLGRFLLEGSVPGFPFLASIIVIFSGAQLFALGIIGEYIARIFNRSMEQPTYAIKENTQEINHIAEEEKKDIEYDAAP
jgi:glycosyltransferase involved in cell wall biosynthesis